MERPERKEKAVGSLWRCRCRPCVLGNPLMDLPFEPFLSQRITPKAVLLFQSGGGIFGLPPPTIHARGGQKFTLRWKFGKPLPFRNFNGETSLST
jgi:hypothetical protein